MMEHTDSARVVNGILDLALRHGGYVPPAGSGAFGLSLWAEFLKCDKETVRRKVKRLKIRHRKDGKDLLITPEDYLAGIPFATKDPPAEVPKRSRKR